MGFPSTVRLQRPAALRELQKTAALLAAKVRGKRLDCQQVLPPTFWIAERILQLRCIGLRCLHWRPGN
jgi:hypothetical protein